MGDLPSKGTRLADGDGIDRSKRMKVLSEPVRPALELNSHDHIWLHPMAELTTNPSPSPTPSAADDPLATLHKMSMTAGLGTQDYVAINTTSFIAVGLGLLGVLSLFWPEFLIASAGGLICAIVSWWQIRSSNGTQTGKSIVLFAVALSLGVGGYVAGNTVYTAYENKEDQQQIGQLIDKFNQALTHHDYDQAYGLCSDEFRKRVSIEKFSSAFDNMFHPRVNGGAGALKSLEWNHDTDWFGTEASGDRIAVALTLFNFENSSEPSQQNLSFLDVRNDAGWHWEVNDIPSMFPKPRQATGGPNGMPMPGEASPEGPSPQ
jgi:hypothetical protein